MIVKGRTRATGVSVAFDILTVCRGILGSQEAGVRKNELSWISTSLSHFSAMEAAVS